jgi:DNA-binding CsgD family transcriptional regulator/tetratricopeptide (TPR) repeat protein
VPRNGTAALQNQSVRASDSQLVGREQELAVVAEFLDSDGAALAIEGEAGIGKTTLWRRALADAAGRDFRILACSASPAETQLAFTAVRDLLDAPFTEVAGELPPPQRRALEVALVRAEPDEDRGASGATAVAFVSALRELVAARPVVIAIDDVQWLDGASAFLLEFAARRLRDERLRLLLTSRSEPDAAAPLGLDRALGERLRRLRVGPLSVGALRRILDERLGLRLPRPALLRLAETAGGNPFFALELARALQRRGGPVVPGAPLPVPRSLHELIGERLAALPAATREALLLVAALSDAPSAAVETALGEEAWPSLRPALDAQVLELVDGAVGFTHPLLRSAVEAGANSLQRRRAHQRSSEVVADPEQRARHLALAASGPDAAIAGALEEAARRAHARGAPGVAGELGELAVQLTPDADRVSTHRRTLAGAAYHFEAGDAALARDLLEKAVESAPSGRLRAEAYARLGRANAFMADHRGATRAYRRALDEPEADAESWAAAEQGLAVALMRMLQDLPAAARHARAAASLAERRGDRTALPEYLATVALIEGLRGRSRAAKLMRQAEALYSPAPVSGFHRSYFLRGLRGADFMLGALFALRDDVPAALARLERAHRAALDLGDDSSLPLILRYLAQVKWLAGSWKEARLLAAEGEQLAVETGQPAQQAVCAGMRAVVHAHGGEVEPARQAAAAASRLAEATSSGFAELLARFALGSLALSLGDAAACDRQLTPLLARLQAAGVGEPGLLRFVPDQIEALLALGRRDEAAEALAWLEERALRLDRAPALATCARCRALLQASGGDVVKAVATAQAALAQHERAPIPFERARTLLVVGRLRRLVRRKREARDALEQAAATFADLGARLWLEQSRAELARISGRARSRSDLTASERTVAALAAAGKTNREIASELYVTPKTVEFHLRNVYGKLGVRSRIELARTFASAKD